MCAVLPVAGAAARRPKKKSKEKKKESCLVLAYCTLRLGLGGFVEKPIQLSLVEQHDPSQYGVNTPLQSTAQFLLQQYLGACFCGM